MLLRQTLKTVRQEDDKKAIVMVSSSGNPRYITDVTKILSF